MKNKEFYHTSVELKEYPFDIIYLKEITPELIQNINAQIQNLNKNLDLNISEFVAINLYKI